MEYHNRETAYKLAHGALKNYYTTQRYIEKFFKEKYRRNDIALSELNYRFIMDFEGYLQKYRPKATNLGKLFPVISNQRMNSYLKEIADICGLRNPTALGRGCSCFGHLR